MQVPVNEPIISKKAKKYVNEALNSGWISSAGSFIDKFESQFAKYLGVKYATTVSNGTTALHLALAAVGVGSGDEVIVPDQTIISCAAAVVYLGAKPIFVDVEKNTGNLNPAKLESAISKKTKAIMVVDLFGHPADFDPIKKIAKKYSLPIVEDAAEAHGAEYKGKKAGSLGDIATFSFYANKILTTGEGGMVVTNNKSWIEKVRQEKNLSHRPGKRFFHDEIGYNYRLTNLQAALGLANLEDIDQYLSKKMLIASMYINGLKNIPELKLPIQENYAKSVYWMFNVEVTDESRLSREVVMKKLLERGIDTRTYFFPLHTQPALQKYVSKDKKCPVSLKLSETGFYLPSGLTLKKHQINYVIKTLKEIFQNE